eukprot:Seg2473.6 transcript_id=Seg2473.6/GoldUCD/mRNA.D3Y31 product="hypothetical protein" protein_id=Seg2473.6/GoldUCD/D3Y31
MRKIAKLTEIIQSSTSPQALQTATMHVNSAITVAEGLGQLDNDHAYDLKPKEKYPANKLFEVQERFKKTKKTAKKPQKTLSLPSTKKQQDMKAMLAEELPMVCAFCFEENDSDFKDEIEWVECPQCGLRAHWKCDQNETKDKSTYRCSVCRSV